jgi:hypothetical protein
MCGYGVFSARCSGGFPADSVPSAERHECWTLPFLPKTVEVSERDAVLAARIAGVSVRRVDRIQSCKPQVKVAQRWMAVAM